MMLKHRPPHLAFFTSLFPLCLLQAYIITVSVTASPPSPPNPPHKDQPMPSLSDLITLDCTHVGIDTIHLHTPSVPFDPNPAVWGPGGGTFIPHNSTRDPYPVNSYSDPQGRFYVKVGARFSIQLTTPRILYPDNRNPLPLHQLHLVSDFLQEQFDYLGLPCPFGERAWNSQPQGVA